MNIYPIVKDTNGTIINPNLWCKFDTGSIITNYGTDSITLTNNSVTNANVSVKGDNSASFNGRGGYLNGTIEGIANNSFSVSMWIYPLTTSSTKGVCLGLGSVGGPSTYTSIFMGIGIHASNKYWFGFLSDDDSKSVNTYASDVNTWVYLTFTYNSSTKVKKIYRNGVSIEITNSTSAQQPNPDNVIVIGNFSRPGTYYYNGYMDDLRIYKGLVLTPEQVLTLYKPVVYTKNIYGQDVIEEKKLDYELIKYPSRFPDTIGAIDAKNKEQTFTINNSDYKVKFSSYSDDYKEATPLYLFDGNTNNQNKNENMGGYFGNKTENKYNQTIGTYNGTSSFEGTKGEWVSITFPTSFILKKYGFIAKADREANAPGSWVLYAKTTGNTYQSIDTSSATLTERDYNNVNTLYNKLILDNPVSSNTYVFVFTGLTNTTNNNFEDNNLNFIEILLYGIINE